MDAFSRSVLKQIEELSAKLESTRNMVGFEPEWSEAVPIEKAIIPRMSMPIVSRLRNSFAGTFFGRI